MKLLDSARFILLTAIAIVVAACGPLTPIEKDTVPVFADSMVRDRVYLVSSLTCSLALPAATGGNGALSYSVTPLVDDWTFDPASRILSIMPTATGTWNIVYRVDDADENTDDSDSAELTFTITIKDPGDIEFPDEGIASAYQGCGNQWFFLNPEGASLAGELYTLVLDAASADVYLIATNTTTDTTAPTIQPLNLANPSTPTIRHPVDSAAAARHFHTHEPPHPDPSRTQFDPITLLPSTLAQSASEPRPPAQEGDRFVFWDTYPDEPQQIPATARRVVTDGTTSAVFWVEDTSWGTCMGCITQEMLNVVADDFLRSGSDNDIHDWVTAIFGPPWGPYPKPPHRSLLPPEYGNELHILFLNSEEEYGGYHSSRHTYLQAAGATYSNERLMFFMNTKYYSPEEQDLDEFLRFRRRSIALTLAHEYQHMIRNYQKSVLNSFRPRNESWLNEMASEMTEEFVSYKLMVRGLRGLPHDDPTAGSPPIFGSYSRYNYYNYLQGAYFEFDSPLYRYYATNFVLGSYLALTYGGAPLMGAIAQNEHGGVESIEAAIVELGYPPTSFEEILTNWAVANLLSDDTDAPVPYRYNSGEWSTSVAGGISFRLGSVNLFNYRYGYGEGPDEYHDGPYFFSVDEFNAAEQVSLSNRYVNLGHQTGMVQLRVNAPEGVSITVLAKE